MTQTPTLEQLKWTADYRAARDAARALPAILMALCGVVGASVGGVVVLLDPRGLTEWSPLLVLSAVGFGIGLWLFLRPSPVALLLEALSGLTLFALVFVAGIRIKGGLTDGAILGIGLGVGTSAALVGHALRTYRRFQRLPPGRPDDAWLKWLARTAKAIRASNPKDREDVLVFKARGVVWRAMLLEQGALLVFPSEERLSLGRDSVVVEYQNDVEILPDGSQCTGETVRATFRLAKRKLKGTIEREHLQRYTEWKTKGPSA